MQLNRGLLNLLLLILVTQNRYITLIDDLYAIMVVVFLLNSAIS